MANAAAYADHLRALLPRGRAWSREPASVLGRLLAALAETLARIDARAVDLIQESDPRQTDETLSDWERVTSLPDPCAGDAPTEDQRRAQLVARLRGAGGPTPAGFAAYADDLGFQVAVETLRPFRVGWSRCGDRLGATDIATAWLVTAPAGDNAVLECELRALAPSHSTVLFDTV